MNKFETYIIIPQEAKNINKVHLKEKNSKSLKMEGGIMRQKERVDKILSLLRDNGYVNAKYLCDEIGYSKATINRDLNFMEKQKLIVRSYGGVELKENKGVTLAFRYHKMKREKKNICKAAAELVVDGDVIFIDSSSTTEFMVYYIAEKKDITVITNNMAVVNYLSDYSNIKTICLGGEIVEAPSMLGGDLCVKNALSYKADKFFFSTRTINENGEIGGGTTYPLLLNVMAKNSDKIIYLADHTKINLPFEMVVLNAEEIDIIISDYNFSEEFKEKCNKTQFIKVN